MKQTLYLYGAIVQLCMVLVLIGGCATTPTGRAGSALDQVPRKTLNANQLLAVRLQEAQLAVTELRPNAALTALNTSVPADTPDTLRLAYHQLRAEAYALNSDYVASARERVWMDPLLTNPEQRYNNQTQLWKTLSRLSDADLQPVYRSGRKDALYGWIELVRLSREYRQQPEALSRAVARWDRLYPGHPANEGLLKELLEKTRQTREIRRSLRQVALLLPLTGRLTNAGTAVRDGFLAANANQPKGLARPVVRVYDVGPGPQVVARQYHQAVEDGAEMVVGPLDRAAVAELARARRLSVPVLALNYADNSRWLPKSLYQFGLSPEDEARHVAWQARLDNHQTAVALVPQGSWGTRVLAAFRERWSELGGELLESQTYDPSQTDFATPIRELLNLTESRARYRNLRQRLGGSLKFEPRRRKDVDFVFLVALPAQARLLGPQLRFHHAARLPVYSTSHIYTGIPNPQTDQDMNGIQFCDMPWVLEKQGSGAVIRDQLLANASRAQKRQTRLYALGVDAYNVLPYLDKLGEGAFSRFHGVTGNLYLDNKRRIHRELV
ncbi:MAG: penicillin-binding protein activator, partial [Gammaproteobacteria bacterium]